MARPILQRKLSPIVAARQSQTARNQHHCAGEHNVCLALPNSSQRSAQQFHRAVVMAFSRRAELAPPRSRSRRSAKAESAKRHQSMGYHGAAERNGWDRFGPHARVSGIGAGGCDCLTCVGEVVLPEEGVRSRSVKGCVRDRRCAFGWRWRPS